jgi:hypothetical protein
MIIKNNTLYKKNSKKVKRKILFDKAEAGFHLSIDPIDLKKHNKKVVRDFFINNKRIDLAKNFENAHTDCYKDILNKSKYAIHDVERSIRLVLDLNKSS